MFGFIKEKVRKKKYQRCWRKGNQDNNTLPLNYFDLKAVKVGRYTYGGLNVYNYNVGQTLTIGSFCSIASDVMFILNADHPINNMSTFPFHVDVLKDKHYEATSKGDIIVDDDVWIGFRSTIMSGVHIGQGAVVAAGAVVTKDVPPYAIVGGVPAKIIKYRFSPEVIEQLLKLDYSKLTDDMIRERIDDLYTSLDGKSPEEVEKLLAWFPKNADK
ncbi:MULTISPECIES: DapH/DapD/GlmU-related protein [Porcincola]|uniref:DapH/DapD/GlmU-related protein n=1 Tax=Porcincola TaxID=2815778 RepID=UPI0023F01C14|nr:DapH/DapD/GlmU-related protein [Porcincola intestinalis]MCI6767835.1 CatB-related O-acetyltransferase [Lachnospiraceae bacterium]MDD7060223.1 DapH/DapD/GlmU-related protein [Porcincola intestinalis]MDY5284291.1 DapH/DapD/GlmU-related protein [Porcincola intestinalis]